MNASKTNKIILSIFKKSRMSFEYDKTSYQDNNMKSAWLILFRKAINNYIRFTTDNFNNTHTYTNFIQPFLLIAYKEVTSLKNNHYTSLSISIQAQLENQLFNKLVRICDNSIPFIQEKENIDHLIKDEHINPLSFFKKYSVLARLLSQTTHNWINNTNILLKRLVCDFPELCELFSFNNNTKNTISILNKINRLDLDLSDPHNYGESVTIITFNCRNKVVYKPKSMKSEHSLYLLTNQINEHLNIENKLYCLPVIDKEHYGWSKYIDHKPCRSDEKISAFYRKIGMFSAIFYILRGTDYHHDNIISHGENPVFIDNEMMFYPVISNYINNNHIDMDISESQSGYYESVINTRLFPIKESRLNGDKLDISGTGFFRVKSKNTHLPNPETGIVDLSLYKNDIFSGFIDIFNFFMDNKYMIINDPKWLRIFKQTPTRFNIRATSTYISINNLCLSPKALESGKNFCNQITLLQNHFPSISLHEFTHVINREELKVLARLDVPRFTLNCCKKHLEISGNIIITDFLEHKGYQLVTQRIKDLSKEVLDQQLKLIDDSISL